MKKIIAVIIAVLVVAAAAVVICVTLRVNDGKAEETAKSTETVATTTDAVTTADTDAVTTEGEVTEEETTAVVIGDAEVNKVAYYTALAAEDKITIAGNTVKASVVGGDVEYSMLASDGYFKMNNGDNYTEIIVADGKIYLHMVTAEIEADEELGVEATPAFDTWSVTDSDEETVESVDGITDMYSTMFGDFSFTKEDLESIVSMEYVETVNENGKDLDCLRLIVTVEDEEEEDYYASEETEASTEPETQEVLMYICDADKTLNKVVTTVYSEDVAATLTVEFTEENVGYVIPSEGVTETAAEDFFMNLLGAMIIVFM